MSDGDGDNESFEEKLRALAREVSDSVERAAAQFDLDEVAEAIGLSAERAREFADFAGRWLGNMADGFQPGGFGSDTSEHEHDEPAVPELSDEPALPDEPEAESAHETATGASPLVRNGPHPLDLPTEQQGLALSALDSGRWKVEPGSSELVADGSGPAPRNAVSLVGELRARDWIAASGEVTLVGRDALRRWLDSAHTR